MQHVNNLRVHKDTLLATHVQVAIAGGSGPSVQPLARAAARPLAPHVQAAITGGGRSFVQPLATAAVAPLAPHVLAAIARGGGTVLHQRTTATVGPLAPQVPAPTASLQRQALQAKAVPQGAVVQPAESRHWDEIQGIFRNWAYPIGNPSIARLGGGTGSYDVGAKVYDSKSHEIGSGEYSSGTMVHAEIAALENALAGGHTLTDVNEIRVTKGCCRRCAVVLKILGLADKVGPVETSSTYSGAYSIPTNVRATLAGELTKYKIDDIAPVIEKGTWW